MSIKAKIVLAFVSSFSIIMVALVGVFGILAYNTSYKQVSEHLNSVAGNEYSRVLSYIGNHKSIIELMAASTAFREFLKTTPGTETFEIQKEKSYERLNRTKAVDSSYVLLFILNPNGIVVNATDRNWEGFDFHTDSVYVEGKTKTFVSDIHFLPDDKTPIISLSAPIKDDASGNLLGVMVINLSPDKLYADLDEMEYLGNSGDIFIVNKDRFFASSPHYLDKSVILKQKINTDRVNSCLDNKTPYTPFTTLTNSRDYRGVDTVGLQYYIPEMQWCLITKMDTSELYTPLTQMTSMRILLVAIGQFLFALVGLFIGKKIADPIIKLKKDVEIIQAGNVNYKVGTTSKDEIGELSRAFDKLNEKENALYKDMEKIIKAKTKELEASLTQLEEKNTALEDTTAAIKNVLEDVEEEKVKQEALLTGMGEGVVACDTDLRIIYMNDEAQKMLGFQINDALGKIYTEIVVAVDNEGKPISETERMSYQAATTGKTIRTLPQQELYYLKKDKTKIPVAITVSPIRLNNKIFGQIIVFSDITKEKEIDRMKTEFVSLASHQLRTPLSAMKWYLEMLIDGDAGKLNKEQLDFIKNINASNERMIELVTAILNVSRIESGRIMVDPVPTDIRTLVQEVTSDLAVKLSEKNIQLITSYNNDMPLISVDPKLIRQVFLNLLSNSIKYTPKDGEIHLFVSKDIENLVIQIADNGYGIPEKDKEKVFTKFYRGENILSVQTEGNGLGLYLVKAIIESSNGKIWYDSKEGKGTTFWFTLPLAGSPKKKGVVSIDS